MMQNTRKRMLLVAFVSTMGVAAATSPVWAGSKTEESVSITVSGSNATAAGAVGTARNSADTNQFISCTVQGFTGSNAVFCSARTAAGTNFSCTGNGANLAASVAAMDTGSRLFIFAQSGVCQQIDVTNSSQHKPKVP